MAVAAAIFIPAGAVTVGLSKRAQNRRKQAAANEFSKKYPLIDDAGTMDSYIMSAKSELRSINASPAETAGAKRVKNRNSQTLNKWISVMSEHRRDLQAGLNIASSQVDVKPTSGNTGIVPPKISDSPYPALPSLEKDEPKPAPTEDAASTETAAQTQKKGVNWLLIGGVVIGVILVTRMLKK